ncbi:MAG: acyltransferase [Microthrixaceae bacterium]|nr:acyltransferase [Microthrixaceae bacterium]
MKLHSAEASNQFESVAPRLGFVPAFDGVRGYGVLIVLLGHLFPEETDSFNPIVDVFFVISAFLIVTLLLQERRDYGHIALKRFYSRRAIRLLPNSYACMVAWLAIWALVKAVGVELTGEGAEQVNAIPNHVAAAATYSYNLIYPIGGPIGPLGQFWSLSLEEQFYLFAGFGTAFFIATRRRIWVGATVMVALILWIGWSRFNADLGPWPGSEVTTIWWQRGMQLLWLSRPDALLVGVLLALLNAKLPDPLSPQLKKAIHVVGWIGLVACCVVLVSSLKGLYDRGFPFYLPGIPRDASQFANRDGELWCALEPHGPLRPCTDDLWIFRWVFSVMAIAIAPVALCFARYKDSALSKLFCFGWIRKVGEMSYSLYVWHILAFTLAQLLVQGSGRLQSAVVKLVVAFGISWLAHRYIDRAMLGLKLRFASEKVVLDRRTGQEVAIETVTSDDGSAPSDSSD